MKIKALALSLVAVAALAVNFAPAFAIRHRTYEAVGVPPDNPKDQGCINQGNDRREFAAMTCWLQRHLSWKSEREPYFALLGKPNKTNLGLAWPPYLVFNSPDGGGHWRMFRVGFRYDRNWRGYIFPTLAAKRVSRPLRY